MILIFLNFFIVVIFTKEILLEKSSWRKRGKRKRDKSVIKTRAMKTSNLRNFHIGNERKLQNRNKKKIPHIFLAQICKHFNATTSINETERAERGRRWTKAALALSNWTNYQSDTILSSFYPCYQQSFGFPRSRTLLIVLYIPCSYSRRSLTSQIRSNGEKHHVRARFNDDPSKCILNLRDFQTKTFRAIFQITWKFSI